MGISVRAFAKRIGLSHTAVQNHIKRGSISTLPDGTIDPLRGEREWKANTHPGRGKGASNGTHAPDAAEGYRTARAIRESFDARLLEMRYRREMGELLEASEVREQAFKAARRVRDLLQTIAPRLAPVVAGLTATDDCYRAIEEEINRALDELARVDFLKA